VSHKSALGKNTAKCRRALSSGKVVDVSFRVSSCWTGENQGCFHLTVLHVPDLLLTYIVTVRILCATTL
jgi:hypothetical protein